MASVYSYWQVQNSWDKQKLEEAYKREVKYRNKGEEKCFLCKWLFMYVLQLLMSPCWCGWH